MTDAPLNKRFTFRCTAEEARFLESLRQEDEPIASTIRRALFLGGGAGALEAERYRMALEAVQACTYGSDVTAVVKAALKERVRR